MAQTIVANKHFEKKKKKEEEWIECMWDLIVLSIFLIFLSQNVNVIKVT